MNHEKNIITHSKKSLLQYIFFCCPSLFYNKNNSKTLVGEFDLGPPLPYDAIGFDKGKFKKTLILDLDETLVYSSLTPFAVKKCDFSIKFSVGSNNLIYESYVLKRPGLDDFLNYVKEKFEVAIFTASMKEYADAVINVIAPWIPVSHRFYRHHCSQINGIFIKDLSKFNRPINSIILVDDSNVALMINRSNVITISSWFGEANDRELERMTQQILSKLDSVDDVRSAIRKLI